MLKLKFKYFVYLSWTKLKNLVESTIFLPGV